MTARQHGKGVIGMIAMLAGMMAGQVGAAQEWTGQSAPSQPAIVTVQSGALGASVAIGGSVVAFKEVTLTAQLPGRIEFIAGAEGDKFSADQVLVAIDDDDLLAKRRAALAQLSTAQAGIGSAQMEYSRELYSPQSRSISRSGGMGMPSLFDQMFTQPFFSNMMPGSYGGNQWVDRQADLHNRGTALSQAQSQYAAVRSQLDEIDAKLRDARSFAPFDGVIVKKLVEQGDTVNPGQPLMMYADLSYLQIEVDVPSRLMPGLSKGMLVPARLDVGNSQVQARVAQIFPTADSKRHTVKVKFDLPVGVSGGPGMYAEVLVPDVTVPVNAVPTIPDSAVIWRGSLPAVFVAGDNGEPSLRLIRLGSYLGPRQVSVLSGLKVGERIYAVPPANKRSAWGNAQQPQ